ncbi:MAG: glycosyltransferase, partial [Chloroflexota bacterium]
MPDTSIKTTEAPHNWGALIMPCQRCYNPHDRDRHPTEIYMRTLRYAASLIRVSYTLLRDRGPRAFSNRLVRWLQGERTGFVSQRDYTTLMASTDPTPHQLEQQRHTPAPLTFAIVTPVYQPPHDVFAETVASVLEQTYTNWVWYLLDASPTDDTWHHIQQINDERIKPVRLEENTGISGNTNVGLRMVTEEFVVNLDHDDVLAPHALFTLHEALLANPAADVLYSDYDKITPDGQRFDPFLKPAWSPETMLCANIVTHLTCYRRSLLEQVGYLNPAMDGSQDWDLYLRMSEATDRFVHVPGILYHWRVVPDSVALKIDNKPYARTAQVQLLLNHLERTGSTEFTVRHNPQHPIRRSYPIVTWTAQPPRKVAIIIDGTSRIPGIEMVSWLSRQLPVDRTEITLLLPENDDDVHYAHSFPGVNIVAYTGSPVKAQHTAATAAGTAMLVFIRDTLTFPDGLAWPRLWQWYARENIGAVGIKVLTRRNRILHAGMVLDEQRGFRSLFAGEPHNLWTYFGTDGWYRNVTAVGGGFMVVPGKRYREVGGFDLSLEAPAHMVDLCLRLRDAGYR